MGHLVGFDEGIHGDFGEGGHLVGFVEGGDGIMFTKELFLFLLVTSFNCQSK